MTKKTLPKLEERKEKRVVRQFTPDYREQVIALIKQEKRSVTSVSRELGLSSSLIYGWIQKSEAAPSPEKGKDSSPLLSKKMVLPANYASELAKLRKENDELKEERDILKKFMAANAEVLGIYAKTPR
jgi:transposase